MFNHPTRFTGSTGGGILITFSVLSKVVKHAGEKITETVPFPGPHQNITVFMGLQSHIYMINSP